MSEGMSKLPGMSKIGSIFSVGVGAVGAWVTFTLGGAGEGKLWCLTCLSGFIFVNPANSFQFDLVVSCFVLMVSKNSSCWTWNCGDILHVVRLRTRDTVLACLGELPRYRPRVHRGSHFGMDFPPCSLVSKA